MKPPARPAAGIAALLLALTCSVVAAPGVGSASEQTAEVAAPVFSARRVPLLVQRVVAEPDLQAAVDDVVAQSPPQTCITVTVAGERLVDHQADRSLIPASNQKTVTAQLALEVLGPDHRFRTVVGGELSDGVVQGDLYLVGGGDPVLRTEAYQAHFGDQAGEDTSIEALADAVVDAGVTRVTGSVVGDESRYDAVRTLAGWPDRYLGQGQIGPLSALTLDQNFTSFPETYSDETLDQRVPAEHPPSFVAAEFSDLLEARGVSVQGAPTGGVRPDGTPVIAEVTSPPLTEIVAQLLNRSDNQIAELLVKEAGVVSSGEGTSAAGLTALTDAFAARGLPGSGVQMHDGSGLDYDDRLTCDLLDALLDRAGPDSAVGEGLAVAGRTGTLADRFVDPALEGRIRAKTGSLNEVTSLAGFAESDGGATLVFTYIANGAPVTSELLGVQESLGRALVAYGTSVPVDELGPS